LSAKLGAAEATLRGEKVSLTHRQVAALVGIWFRHELAEHGDNLGSDPEGWNLVPDDLLDRVAEIGGDGRPPDDYATALRPGDRDDAAALLAEHGFPAEPDAIARVRRALFDAKVLAAKILARRAGGDWQPDHSGARFPPASDVSPAASQQAISKGDGCTMDALLAGWVADHGCRIDAKPEPRALYDRRRTIERLPAFLGHRDADAVIKADALRGKEDMQKRGLHVSSIRNDISEMSAVWRWRMQNCKLHCATPFQGISPLKVKRRSPARSSLWPDIPPDNTFGSRRAIASKRVGRWLRGIGITDQRIRPSHSWRHWFIDACRAARLHPEVRSALTGHSARRDESANYGAARGCACPPAPGKSLRPSAR
jgi:integrase